MTLTRRISRDGGKDKGGASLLVKSGPDKGACVKIDASLVVGSQPDCGLTLADPTVSRNHAEVSRTSEGYLLQDLGSTNGTFLNGVRVDRAYLREGAVITMGETDLEFCPCTQSEQVKLGGTSAFGEMVAVSDGMQRVFALLEGLAASDVTVLLEGETGTGKELAARAVHERSQRAGGPFVVFDCSTVPSELMESELFGHIKGAFTGAAESRKGAVEEAKGGTLFLDEIGELPLNLQPKLLRLLDRREFRKLGTTKTVSADIRFVTATNRDLGSLVKQDKFRKDLLYRVSAARVVLPPLRERPEDIPALGNHFIEQISRGGSGDIKIGPDAMNALKKHDWPGNVREMKNILETAAALCRTNTLSAKDLSRLFVEMDHTKAGSLKIAEAGAVRKALEKAGGNRRKAARQLGIAPSTLYAKMKKYGLE
jgi:DNA-binding NtrC family response regulator